MKALGRELRRLRIEKGWSLQRLSAESRISVAGIQKIERGATNPSLQTALNLTEALGQRLPDLVAASRVATRAVTVVHGSAPRLDAGAADLSATLRERTLRTELLAVAPKSSARVTKAPVFVYVVEGRVDFCFDGERTEQLRANDAIHLEDRLPRRIVNSTARRSLLLCVTDLRERSGNERSIRP